jgi:GntR family transcriptional repressor for pyruvate dehydrogenase complex
MRDGDAKAPDETDSPFEPVDVERIADSVVEQIEDLLVSGALRPGQKLPPERELAEAMQVSRPKLREAMHRLEEAGLIEIRRSDGAFVRELVAPVLAPPMIALCARHMGAFLDFLEYRREQESLAAGLAAERATEADLAALSAAVAAMEAERGDDLTGTMARHDLAFHLALVEASHNAMLLHVMRSVYDLVSQGVFARREVLYQRAETRGRLIAQHREIAEAIRARAPDRARAAAAAHIDFVAGAFREAETTASRQRVARKRRAGTRLAESRARGR